MADIETQLDRLIAKIDRVLEAQAVSATQQANMQCDITEIKSQVRETNGKVKDLDSRVCVLEDRSNTSGPILKETTLRVADMKTELAVLGVKYGSLGGVLALVFLVAKLLGLF